MLSDSLIETFRAKLDELGLELADLRIGGTSHRPLVQVRIEWPASDPSRRFNIYVKSEPPGADIFLDGKPKPVGATPISLPIAAPESS